MRHEIAGPVETKRPTVAEMSIGLPACLPECGPSSGRLGAGGLTEPVDQARPDNSAVPNVPGGIPAAYNLIQHHSFE